jgi:hypothetical protein
MIRCYHCGTDNLDGSEYCDECGKKLNASGTPARPTFTPPPPPLLNTQAAPPPPPSFTRETITPKPATPYTPPPPPVQPPVQQERRQAAYQQPQTPPATNVSGQQNQTTAYNGPAGGLRGGGIGVDGSRQDAMNKDVLDSGSTHVHARLIIQRGGKVGKEFPLTGNESMIGRWDADGGIFPDVDLDQDDPEAKVSRRHARIHFLNNQFLIEDLGSTNGTFVNRGPRLLPGNKQPLNNGDEIIVGKTFLKFVLS